MACAKGCSGSSTPSGATCGSCLPTHPRAPTSTASPTPSPIGPQPFAGLRLSLMAYAYFLEHEGRLEEALEVLALAVRTHGSEVPAGDFAASALFAGRLNRLLARWNEATACYMSAESAAERAGDRVLGLRSRLGRGAVLRGQGNLPLARAIVEVVIEAARGAGLRDVEAIALMDLGAVYAIEGRRVEAVQANYEAFRLTEDALQRMRVLGDLGIGLEEIGAVDGARIAFELVVGARTSFLVRTNALLELMELESSVGDRMAFERRRAEAEKVQSRMPPSMLTDYLLQGGRGTGAVRTGRSWPPISHCGAGAGRDPSAERLVFPVRESPREPDGL